MLDVLKKYFKYAIWRIWPWMEIFLQWRRKPHLNLSLYFSVRTMTAVGSVSPTLRRVHSQKVEARHCQVHYFCNIFNLKYSHTFSILYFIFSHTLSCGLSLNYTVGWSVSSKTLWNKLQTICRLAAVISSRCKPVSLFTSPLSHPSGCFGVDNPHKPSSHQKVSIQKPFKCSRRHLIPFIALVWLPFLTFILSSHKKAWVWHYKPEEKQSIEGQASP